MKQAPLRLAATALAWVALSSGSAPRVRAAAVSVDVAKVVRTVDERLFGINAVIWDPRTSTPETMGLVQSAGLRFIRMGGGSLSNQYHWRVNRTENADGTLNTWTWSASAAAFARLAAGAGAQAVVTTNYGTGTAEEAAAWVAWTNASPDSAVVIGVDEKGYDWKTAGFWASLRAAAPLGVDDGMNFLRVERAAPYGFRHWEVGNECYGSWEVDRQAVAHDPYTYAQRARLYLERMKAVDPSIKVGVVAVTGEASYTNNLNHPATNPRTGIVRYGWTPVMLATLHALGTTPDFLVYHRYEQAPKADQPGNPESDAALLQKAQTWPADAADLRQQLSDYLGAAGASVELLVTENNSVYAKPGKQTTSLVNGLFLADSVGQLLQTEFNALAWWDLRNGQETGNNNDASLYGWRQYGDYGILSTPSAGGSTTYYEGYPTYHVLKLLQRLARGGDRVVQAGSSDKLLAVFAVHGADGNLRLLVINKSPDNTLTGDFTLSGYTPAANATAYSYGIPQDAAAQPGGSGSVDAEASPFGISGESFSRSFSPYSVSVLVLPLHVPWIITQPNNEVATVGGTVAFAVGTGGKPAPALQWRKDGVDIPGATADTLVFVGVQAGDAGTYTVVATNSAGTATSVGALLKVVAAVQVPAGFDAEGYLARYPEVAAVIGTDPVNAWLYYRDYGIYDGEVFDEQFRVLEYLELYPELAKLFGDNLGAALEHWLATGRIEGRLGRIPLEFSAAGYFARNPDVAAAVKNDPILGWQHYWNYGIYEGRAYDDEFRAFEYVAMNKDLQDAFLQDWRGATLHWMRYGKGEGRLGRVPTLFSVSSYLARNPDVGPVWGTEPTTIWQHFWLFGIYELRNFDDEFRVDEYMSLNPTVAAAVNYDRRVAFMHWVRYGRSEGRQGRYQP